MSTPADVTDAISSQSERHALVIPLLSLTLEQKDVAALSTSTTARRAYDLISDNFGPRDERAAAGGGFARLARPGLLLQRLGQLPGLGGQLSPGWLPADA